MSEYYYNSWVQELAENPLLCTIIAIIYRNNRVLPHQQWHEGKVEVFDVLRNLLEGKQISRYRWWSLEERVRFWQRSKSQNRFDNFLKVVKSKS